MRKTALAFATVLGLATASPAFAHCDSLDGPVVEAARKALDSGDPSPALIWVGPENEAAVRQAFLRSVEVRRLGPQARELADLTFFETLVRLHRAGEGAAYTGLKPAGHDFGPAVRLADEAVASGQADKVAAAMSREVGQGVRTRFETLQRQRSFEPGDLRAGRAYVASYVTFVHYVEGLHKAAEGAAPHADQAGVTPDAH